MDGGPCRISKTSSTTARLLFSLEVAEGDCGCEVSVGRDSARQIVTIFLVNFIKNGIRIAFFNKFLFEGLNLLTRVISGAFFVGAVNHTFYCVFLEPLSAFAPSIQVYCTAVR